MTTHKSRVGPALATLAVLLLVAPSALAAEHPFYSEATLVLVETQGNHYTREGGGQATHLGQFTEVNHYKAKGDTRFYGVATLTGANGDSLVLRWVDSVVG